MKRIQLFEFEDFAWFPKTLRIGMTNLIVVFHKMLGTSEVIANLLTDIKKKHAFSQIVDMGSGSGGAMPETIQKMNAANPENPTKLLLTDLYPNPDLIKQINNNHTPHLTYSPDPLDATNLSTAPAGLKTMMCSFHHMPPDKAKAILKSAQDNNTPILIYEITENFIPTLVWWLSLPLSLFISIVMALVMTPFVRPFSWKQIALTYFIPIIPILFAWDGQASSVRTYTFDDIEILLKDIKKEGYTWTIDQARKPNGKKSGYYILGLPS